MDVSDAKRLVLEYQQALEQAPTKSQPAVLAKFCTPHYVWYGMHPFYEQQGVDAVAHTFWQPLSGALTPLQRRQDIFIAGKNRLPDASADGVWVFSMGHFMGLFDYSWLGIKPTGKMAFLRYAEFHHVVANKIKHTALFVDIISLMQQAGCYPLPPQTGASFIHPGPQTHDGIQTGAVDEKQSVKTIQLINQMVEDLSALNQSGNDNCPVEVMRRSWHDNMLWYGPAGIGATYTIERYRHQHQLPFRKNLTDKTFNGHICRMAEGNYACFFGWPNLSHVPTGGFMGLPGSNKQVHMRVVDVYRREGDKLAENWVFIDMLYYLYQQGLDVLARLEEL